MSEDCDRKLVDDINEAVTKKCDLNKLRGFLRALDAMGEDLNGNDVGRIAYEHHLSPAELMAFIHMMARCYQEHKEEIENL